MHQSICLCRAFVCGTCTWSFFSTAPTTLISIAFSTVYMLHIRCGNKFIVAVAFLMFELSMVFLLRFFPYLLQMVKRYSVYFNLKIRYSYALHDTILSHIH